MMQARWYTPSSATFRSRDTWNGDLNTPVTLNRYTYASNNPVRYWDPTGFASSPAALASAFVSICPPTASACGPVTDDGKIVAVPVTEALVSVASAETKAVLQQADAPPLVSFASFEFDPAVIDAIRDAGHPNAYGVAVGLVSYGFTTLEIAHFLAQAAVETLDFNTNYLDEDLTYRTEAQLRATYEKTFEILDPAPYVNNKVLLGNLIVDGGYDYRGRGWLQVTHIGNYQAAQDLLNARSGAPRPCPPQTGEGPCVGVPELDFVSSPRTADPLLISIGFWLENGFNEGIAGGWGVKEVSGLQNRGNIRLTAHNLEGRFAAFAKYGGLLGIT